MHSVILGTNRIVVLNVELEMRKLIPKIMYKKQSKIEFQDTERANLHSFNFHCIINSNTREK